LSGGRAPLANNQDGALANVAPAVQRGPLILVADGYLDGSAMARYSPVESRSKIPAKVGLN